MRLEIETLSAVGSPREMFARLHPRTRCALLESSRLMDGLSRWSYVAGPAAAILETRGGVTRLEGDAIEHEAWNDPFEALNAMAARIARPGGQASAQRPAGLDFTGGLIGYLGYDLARRVERLPTIAADDPPLPEMRLLVADHVLAYDHLARQWYFCALELPWLDADLRRAAWAETRARAAGPSTMLGRDLPHAFRTGPMRSRTPPEQYRQQVARCLQYVHEGEIYQANLSHRLEADFTGDPFAAYTAIVDANPAPFAAYLEAEDFAIASASPERFLKLQDGCATARPIKGTRPRFAAPAEDAAQQAALAASDKDRAENLMIVDLMRNDLGRVARLGSVRVERLFAIEDHPSVWQMVSTVRAELRAGAGAADLLKACWPPGSMTGAPKPHAMEIIEALEPVRRGPYAGSIGYLDCGGGMDLSVVIRTAVMAAGRVMVQVGGGIVADSDPEQELQETYAKGRLILKALQSAGS